MTLHLKYGYSFAELLDRLQIVILKIINSSERNSALETEVSDIMNDIQIHLQSTPMNAEMIKGLIVLGFVNQFIFNNETEVREAENSNISDADLLAKLKETHKANSLRAAAKKHIQSQRGERIDPKLNYGKEDNFWNISW